MLFWIRLVCREMSYVNFPLYTMCHLLIPGHTHTHTDVHSTYFTQLKLIDPPIECRRGEEKKKSQNIIQNSKLFPLCMTLGKE